MTIRVGIIGASPDRGWAARAHIPALQALDAFEITAVGTSRAESAQEAARRFGVPHAFTDPRELAEHPDVDLVVITVKVPAHDTLIRAALDAGKHVFSEWPLTRTTAEAEALVALSKNVRSFIGLQARYAPAVAHARQLIAGGDIGRVTSVNVYAALGKGAGTSLPGWTTYTLDSDNGAGTLEVAGGHHLDAVEFMTSPIAEVSAHLSVQRPAYTVEETGEQVTVTSPDQVALTGTLASGALLSAHLHYAKATDPQTRIEISGTEGDLTLVSAGPGAAMGLQIGELRLLGVGLSDGTRTEIDIPERHLWVPEGAESTEVANVARFYMHLGDDIEQGVHSVPDFEAGVRVHRVLDAVRESAATGTRRPV